MPDRPRSATLVPAVFILFMVVCAVFSSGYFEPYDEILHFLYARSVWGNPAALLNIWARPGVTGLFAIAAPLGMIAARLLAVVITALTAVATVGLAERFAPDDPGHFFQRHRRGWLWLLLFAQPCFALNSFTTMTEMPLACAWAWAGVALADRRALRASFLIGVAGLLRPEGWIAIACWPIFITLWQRVNCDKSRGRIFFHSVVHTLIAGLPTLLWYVGGAVHGRDAFWFRAWWPWAPESPYGKTGLFFLVSAAVALGVWMWIPLGAGIRRILGMFTGRRRANAFLVLVVPFAGFFLMHGVLGTLGLFGSMSLPRYFIAVAPQGAVLSLIGLAAAKRGEKWLRWVTVLLALLPMAALVATDHLPAQRNLTLRRYDRAIDILQHREWTPVPPLIAAHPYVLYRLSMPIDAVGDLRIMRNEELAGAIPGTALLLDVQLWNAEHRPSFEQLERWGYERDGTLGTDDLRDPLAFLRYAGEISRVELWIKRK